MLFLRGDKGCSTVNWLKSADIHKELQVAKKLQGMTEMQMRKDDRDRWENL